MNPNNHCYADDGDDYLLKVLGELRCIGVDRGASVSTEFQTSTLEELCRRIALEKQLKQEINRLTKENESLKSDQCAGVSEADARIEKALQEEISQLKVMYEHRITQVVEELAKERDLAMVASQNAQEASIIRDELQNAKNRLTEENARLSDDVQVLQKDISRLTTDCEDKCEQIKNLTKERETESEKMRAAFQHVHDLETAQIRLEVENARLQKENTHLSAESTANTRRLSELDDDELAKYLSEEIKVRKLRLGKPAKINEPGRKTIDITGDSSSTGNCRRWTSKRNAKNEDEGDDTEGEHELEDDFDSKAEEAHASERGISFGIPWLPSCNIPVSRADSPSPRSEPGSLPLRDEVLIFNRHFLQAQLGGGLISLQVRIGVGNLKRKAIGRELEINSFMCPNLDHNPWAPTYPGQDEYMFVGLGKEEGAFLISETHEVFVQFAPKKMFYAGKYECVKTRDSTPTEWHGLDEKLKRRYCKTTISKTKQGGTVETVLRAYDEGELRAPCEHAQNLVLQDRIQYSGANASVLMTRTSRIQNPIRHTGEEMLPIFPPHPSTHRDG